LVEGEVQVALRRLHERRRIEVARVALEAELALAAESEPALGRDRSATGAHRGRFHVEALLREPRLAGDLDAGIAQRQVETLAPAWSPVAPIFPVTFVGCRLPCSARGSPRLTSSSASAPARVSEARPAARPPPASSTSRSFCTSRSAVTTTRVAAEANGSRCFVPRPRLGVHDAHGSGERLRRRR
jgi:hypothetical protein